MCVRCGAEGRIYNMSFCAPEERKCEKGKIFRSLSYLDLWTNLYITSLHQIYSIYSCFKEHSFYSESFKVQHINLSSPPPHSSHSEGLLLILPLAHMPFSWRELVIHLKRHIHLHTHTSSGLTEADALSPEYRMHEKFAILALFALCVAAQHLMDRLCHSV